MKLLIFITILVLLFSGCVGEKGQKSLNQTPGSQESVNIGETQGELSVSIENLVELAKQDLAKKAKTPITKIKIIGVTPVEWTDASLGYPEPGKKYAPMTIPGYVIILMIEDKLYEYHSDDKRIVPPQEHLKEPSDLIQPDNTTKDSSKVVDMAKKDLAERLKISETNILVLRTIPTEWPDTSLGYPKSGMRYSQVLTPGYVILLSANNISYEYHSDQLRIVAPPK